MPAVAQAFICVGILLAYIVGLPYQHNEPQHVTVGGQDFSWWQVMFLAGIVPAVLQVRCPLLQCRRAHVKPASAALLIMHTDTSLVDASQCKICSFILTHSPMYHKELLCA
jgi:hypothetical protein